MVNRILIVSNRLPVSVVDKEGVLEFTKSVGGLATGLSSLNTPVKTHWIGWPGIASDGLTKDHETQVDHQLDKMACSPVHLSSKDVQEYYLGFSNETIWPLFHYFNLYCRFDQATWEAYVRVNRAFFEQVCRVYEPGDTIWIHDYQLMLLPEMIRSHFPDASIGFFLHIPFPSFELLRLLPWREEILRGLLGADLVGFHEYDYVRHFFSSVSRILGHEQHLSEIAYNNRIVRADAFPMGINYERFSESRKSDLVRAAVQKLKKQNPYNRRLIISVDRLDYTKGITNRLEAFDAFLRAYPEYKRKVKLVVVAVPSRDEVEQYIELRERLELLTGHINGEHATIDWTPVAYMYRSLPFEELAALYIEAEVALITPLRDGMNLVAKEFVAANSQLENQGVLILSEMAGAASELSEAVVINPSSKDEIVKALRTALEMPQEERQRKNAPMQARIARYTVGRWASDFLSSLEEINTIQVDMAMKKLSKAAKEKLIETYSKAKRRLFFLDYDGTLIGFFPNPQSASPDERLVEIIDQLSSDPRNEVVIISGRDKQTLTRWLGNLDVNLVAEHGAFLRHRGTGWMVRETLSTDWKEVIQPVMDRFVDRTPGSFVEEKSYSLVWHCRRCDPDLAQLRTHELRDALISMTTNMEIGVFEGSKIVEVKNIGINKGAAADIWLGGRQHDFVFAAGDDYTDEDMFSVLPDTAHSFKLGQGASNAKYQLMGPDSLRALLSEFAALS
ncbi:MAG: bifunctional alpha,alpha-trehalose-phosphate synthase (UDP-forming)/trehalose-phosphatase [Phycisphaeraceae bacterium]|nr:bifunctional alpha,alpha-trehalose-phosphate synthase (UDP-forming)/trehalose-phosphatase [Phycisphaeraceae bacterium]